MWYFCNNMQGIWLYKDTYFPVHTTATAFHRTSLVIYWMAKNDAYYYMHEIKGGVWPPRLNTGLQSNNSNFPLTAAHHAPMWHEYRIIHDVVHYVYPCCGATLSIMNNSVFFIDTVLCKSFPSIDNIFDNVIHTYNQKFVQKLITE